MSFVPVFPVLPPPMLTWLASRASPHPGANPSRLPTAQVKDFAVPSLEHGFDDRLGHEGHVTAPRGALDRGLRSCSRKKNVLDTAACVAGDLEERVDHSVALSERRRAAWQRPHTSATATPKAASPEPVSAQAQSFRMPMLPLRRSMPGRIDARPAAQQSACLKRRRSAGPQVCGLSKECDRLLHRRGSEEKMSSLCTERTFLRSACCAVLGTTFQRIPGAPVPARRRAKDEALHGLSPPRLIYSIRLEQR
jgi:hypothetical protein